MYLYPSSPPTTMKETPPKHTTYRRAHLWPRGPNTAAAAAARRLPGGPRGRRSAARAAVADPDQTVVGRGEQGAAVLREVQRPRLVRVVEDGGEGAARAHIPHEHVAVGVCGGYQPGEKGGGGGGYAPRGEGWGLRAGRGGRGGEKVLVFSFSASLRRSMTAGSRSRGSTGSSRREG